MNILYEIVSLLFDAGLLLVLLVLVVCWAHTRINHLVHRVEKLELTETINNERRD